jgi:hypothetical protein
MPPRQLLQRERVRLYGMPQGSLDGSTKRHRMQRMLGRNIFGGNRCLMEQDMPELQQRHILGSQRGRILHCMQVVSRRKLLRGRLKRMHQMCPQHVQPARRGVMHGVSRVLRLTFWRHAL